MKKIIQKIRGLSDGVKSSIAFAFASLLSSGMSYLTTPIFTRMMTSSEYGQVSVFLTWQSIFGIIAMFSLNCGVFNNGMMDYPDDRSGFSFSLLGLSNLITLCFGLVVFACKIIAGDIFSIRTPYLVIMFLVFLLQPAYNFWLARQRYEYKYKPALIASLFVAVLAPLVSVLMVLSFDSDKVSARIFGLEGTLLLIYAVFFVLLGVNAGWKCNRKYWRYAFLFNLPLLPHYLSTYILSSSDKLMIAKLVGDSATGYYSVAYAIASLGLIVWTAINGSLIPYTYQKCKEKDYDSLKNLINGILLFIFACCIIVIIIAPEVMSFLASGEYSHSVAVIPPVVGGIFFQVHYSLYANILYYNRKPKWVMVASITAAIANIITNYIFIRQFGYIAAGFTTMACYLLQAIIDYLAMRRIVNASIYDMKVIGILSIMILAVSLFGGALYQSRTVRYLILAIVILYFVVFKNKIFNIIQNILKKQ